MSKKINAQNNRFYHVLEKLWTKGSLVKPRGLLCKELTNFQYFLEPRERFMCFDQRKFKLDYAKQEFLWYVRGNRKDTSIVKLASMWKDLVNPDGSINSNYGWYIFNSEAADDSSYSSNFERVIDTLTHDPDSRRAVITILGNDHLNSGTKDFPCTAYLNFQIRKNWFNIYVRMRSQDAIFGMGNDAPCFSFIQELMYCRLKAVYPLLRLGRYWHLADSFHVYERHFDMVESIVTSPRITVDPHATCPIMEYKDVDQWSDIRYTANNPTNTDQKTKFGKWLVTRNDPTTLLGESHDH